MGHGTIQIRTLNEKGEIYDSAFKVQDKTQNV